MKTKRFFFHGEYDKRYSSRMLAVVSVVAAETSRKDGAHIGYMFDK